MNSPQIPANVLQFIAERIDTVPQLEALLLLWENAQRSWAEDEVAGRIYVSRAAATQILQSLQRQNLVTSESAQSTRYQYNPQWDPTGQVMPEVAAAYSRHLVQLATFIHSRASTAVREFARAFDLKKDR
jgi:predicted transcriptional regulator